MLLIPCPWCGPRDEAEFRYGGQAHVAYPKDPGALTDEEWARYLFFRDNPKGPFEERWNHAAGCRRWLTLTRNTATNEILPTATLTGENPPAARAAGPVASVAGEIPATETVAGETRTRATGNDGGER